MLCVAQAELFKEDNKSASKMLHLRFTISERGATVATERPPTPTPASDSPYAFPTQPP